MVNHQSSVQRMFSKGSALLESGNAEQAFECFRNALEFAPLNSTLNLYTGASLYDLERFEEAVIYYKQAIIAAPEMGEAHNNMGNALMALGRFSEAVESFSNAIYLLPSSPVPLTARATALQALGMIAESEADCRNAVKLAPNFAAAHWNLALNLLLQGEYSTGWLEYEWRWRKPDFTSPCRHTEIPLWDGSPLNGRYILLHAEQGFGDAIQFVRYAPLVAQLGGQVFIECHAQLVTLFQSVEGVKAVEPFGSSLPPINCQAPLLSLPRIFDTTLQSVPSMYPYLLVPDEYRQKWIALLSNYPKTLRIGLVWAGKSYPDPLRSCRLEELAPLANINNATYFSLQLGNGSDQTAFPPSGMNLVDLTGQIYDFTDTAALIEQLDLVISIDTAVAHLSGALGKPVYIMLPFAPDWRWLIDRKDSPWYPTMKLFRQKQKGDWSDVVVAIHACFKEWSATTDSRVSEKTDLNSLVKQGYAALQQINLESAERIFGLAHLLSPHMPDILCGLAQLRALEGKTEESIALYKQALKEDSEYYQCLLGLGLVLQSTGRFEEAQKCYEQALEIKPGYLQALNNLGILFRATGKLSEALDTFELLIAKNNNYSDGHFNRSLVLLQLGRFNEGWLEYEWRFQKDHPVVQRYSEIPRWEGQPLRGKCILLHAEQGYGDTIQFIRYADILADQGAMVIVESQDLSLHSLLQSTIGVSEVYTRGTFNKRVDYQLPVMSLPLAFKTELQTIPAHIPYINVPLEKVAAWDKIVCKSSGISLRIGLVWAGRKEYENDLNRSVPFELFAPMLNSNSYFWYSLQVGERNVQHPKLIDLTHNIHDFCDSAALIKNLDLVITVDTAVAHLAGALGCKVWVLLPFAPDWRWMTDRSDSPWYPTMRLFRQSKPGDWIDVIARLGTALISASLNS